MCGGIARLGRNVFRVQGLSPRVRGNRCCPCPSGASRGPIPACAGESATRRASACSRWAYPRVCGGIHPRRFRFPLFDGLSPRVRGNRPEAGLKPMSRGPIPACAGESGWRDLRRRAEGAYPRVCGGIEAGVERPELREGLSPRVRGNLRRGINESNSRGPIPACAGESRRSTIGSGSSGAYPRVCGGIRILAADHAQRRGLSPRVRGNRPRPIARQLSRGPIPACAGESFALVREEGHGGAYPRVCGGIRSQLELTAPI